MKGTYNNQGRKSGGYKRSQIITRVNMWSLDELIADIKAYGYTEEEAIEMIRELLSQHALEKLPNGLYVKK